MSGGRVEHHKRGMQGEAEVRYTSNNAGAASGDPRAPGGDGDGAE